MGCKNSPRCGKAVATREPSDTSHIKINYAGETALSPNSYCPLDRSRIKLARRPIPHWRCLANGHRWPIA